MATGRGEAGSALIDSADFVMFTGSVATGKKQKPDEVARTGFEAMMKGEGDVVTGWDNKLRAAIAWARSASASETSADRPPARLTIALWVAASFPAGPVGPWGPGVRSALLVLRERSPMRMVRLRMSPLRTALLRSSLVPTALFRSCACPTLLRESVTAA